MCVDYVLEQRYVDGRIIRCVTCVILHNSFKCSKSSIISLINCHGKCIDSENRLCLDFDSVFVEVAENIYHPLERPCFFIDYSFDYSWLSWKGNCTLLWVFMADCVIVFISLGSAGSLFKYLSTRCLLCEASTALQTDASGANDHQDLTLQAFRTLQEICAWQFLPDWKEVQREYLSAVTTVIYGAS